MNPQSVTIGVRLGRKLNAVIIAAAQPAPDRVAFCGGVLASIAGAIGGLIGPQTAAELLRISLARLEQQPQLELPPGARLAIAAAGGESDAQELTRLRRDQAEALYWRYLALKDPTQTDPPMQERDAFKAVISEALAERDQLLNAAAP